MNKAVEFLRACQTFYLATADGDQPRVRPFGAVIEYKDRVYLCTSNKKDCFRQMQKNPKVELCGTLPDGSKWIRICGVVAVDPDRAARVQFLKECPLPMYDPDDGAFEVLYFVRGTATVSSFTEPPEVFEI